MSWWWKPYVPVWKRRAQAAKKMDKMRKKGMDIQPVVITGYNIAHTFWGKAWCNHLEELSDFENRLPRGRCYARNGSVCHLDIRKGEIEAKVNGSEMYNVKITIKTLEQNKWKKLREKCAGQVGSMIELLQGKISDQVMSVMTDKTNGLFPLPKEIKFNCSCPDWAGMCKHIAAALYGAGARMDQKPELLFLMRGVDEEELISKVSAKAVVTKDRIKKGRILDKGALSDVFGIDIDHGKKPPTKNQKPRDVSRGHR